MLNITIREMQIKTTMGYTMFTLTRISIVNTNTQKISGVGEDVKKLESSYTAIGNVKWFSWCENSLAVPIKVKYNYHMSQKINPDVYTQKNWKQGLKEILVHQYS